MNNRKCKGCLTYYEHDFYSNIIIYDLKCNECNQSLNKKVKNYIICEYCIEDYLNTYFPLDKCLGNKISCGHVICKKCKLNNKQFCKLCLDIYNFENNIDEIIIIQQWYKKRILFSKYKQTIYAMQELFEIIKMDPRKKNNTYLQNIIQEFSYEN